MRKSTTPTESTRQRPSSALRSRPPPPSPPPEGEAQRERVEVRGSTGDLRLRTAPPALQDSGSGVSLAPLHERQEARTAVHDARPSLDAGLGGCLPWGAGPGLAAARRGAQSARGRASRGAAPSTPGGASATAGGPPGSFRAKALFVHSPAIRSSFHDAARRSPLVQRAAHAFPPRAVRGRVLEVSSRPPFTQARLSLPRPAPRAPRPAPRATAHPDARRSARARDGWRPRRQRFQDPWRDAREARAAEAAERAGQAARVRRGSCDARLALVRERKRAERRGLEERMYSAADVAHKEEARKAAPAPGRPAAASPARVGVMLCSPERRVRARRR
jgi:hypothetical protein